MPDPNIKDLVANAKSQGKSGDYIKRLEQKYAEKYQGVPITQQSNTPQQRLDLLTKNAEEQGKSPAYIAKLTKRYKHKHGLNPKNDAEVKQDPDYKAAANAITNLPTLKLGDRELDPNDPTQQPSAAEEIDATIERKTTEIAEGLAQEHRADVKAKQDEKQRRIDEGEVGFVESVTNTAINSMIQIAAIPPKLEFTYDVLTGDAKGAQRASELLDSMNELNRYTIGFTDLGNQKGVGNKILGAGAATVNAISSFAVSALEYQALPGGALLWADIYANTSKEFNSIVAEEKGVELSELIESGEFDSVTPAAISGAMFVLEKIGIGKVLGTGKKISSLPPTVLRNIGKIFGAAGTEGTTELLQGALEEYNKKIAVTGEKFDAESALEAFAWMGSKEGIETFLQGAVGGKALAGPRVLKEYAQDKRAEVDKKTIDENNEAIAALEDQREFGNLSKAELDALTEAQQVARDKRNEAIKKPYKDLVNVTNEGIAYITSLNTAKLELKQKLAETLKSESMSQEVKDVIIEQFQDKATELDTEAARVIAESNAHAEAQKESRIKKAVEKVKEKFKPKKQADGTTKKDETPPSVQKEQEEEAAAQEEQKIQEEQTKLEEDAINIVNKKMETPSETVGQAVSESSRIEQAESKINDYQKQLVKLGDDKAAGKITASEYSQQSKPLFDKLAEQNRVVYDKQGKRRVPLFNQDGTFNDLALSVVEKGEDTPINLNERNLIDESIDHLQKTFPDIEITRTAEGFNEGVALAEENGKYVPDDAKGFVFAGKVYLHPTKVTRDTPFHEIGHLWVQTLMRKNPKLWIAGRELLKGSEYAEKVRNNPEYAKFLQDKDYARFWEEVMANALGKKAAELFEQKKDQTAWQKFMDKLSTWLKDILGIQSKKDFQDLTLEDWMRVGAISIITGDTTATKGEFQPKSYTAEFSLSEKESKSVTNSVEKASKIELKKNAPVKANPTTKDEATKVFKSTPEQQQELQDKIGKELDGIKKDLAKKSGKARILADVSNEDIIKGFANSVKDIKGGEPVANLFINAGNNIVAQEQTEIKEQKKVNGVVGNTVFESLRRLGILDLDKGYLKDDPITIQIKDHEAFNVFLNGADVKVTEKKYEKPQFTKPAPYEGFDHETGLPLFKKAQGESRNQPQSVLDVINKAIQTEQHVDTEMLSVLENVREQLKPENSSQLRQFMEILRIAREIGKRPYHSLYRYDFRGRIYSAMSYFNHQGHEMAKGLIRVGDKVPLGEGGWKWMMISTTDATGEPETTLEERLEYADEHLSEWMEWASDPVAHFDKWSAMKEPYLFLGSIMELKRALDSGNPLTYESNLVPQMDATTSGAQIMTAATKNREGAEIVNLTDSKDRGDLYTAAGDAVQTWMKEDLPENAEQIAKETIETISKLRNKVNNAKSSAAFIKAQHEFFGFVGNKDNAKAKEIALKIMLSNPVVLGQFRKIMKGPTMTKYYSAGPKAMAKALVKNFHGKEGFENFDYSMAFVLTKKIDQELDTIMPGPAKLMSSLVGIANALAKNGIPLSYKVPITGFNVVQDPKVKEKDKFRAQYYGDNKNILNQNKDGILNLAFNYADKEQMDKSKVASSTAPNVIHSLDALIPAWLYKNTDMDILTIHDSFGTVAGRAQEMYDSVREAFVDIFKNHDVLEDFFNQTIGANQEALGYTDKQLESKKKKFLSQIGNFDIESIKKNEYAFSAGNGIVRQEKLTDKQKFEKEDSLMKETAKQNLTDKVDSILEESKDCK